MIAVFLVALSVGLDNFGAATAIGVSGVDRRLRLRVAVIFGAFEAAMPLLGLALGHSVAHLLGAAAQPLAGALLVATGLYTVVTQLVSRQDPAPATELSVRRLVLIGAALSIDNLVIGFAFGTYHVNIVVAAVTIAVVSVGLSLVGLELGSRVGQRLGHWGELVGGAVLVVVGVAVGASLL